MPTLIVLAIVADGLMGIQRGWSMALSYAILMVGVFIGAVFLRLAIEIWKAGNARP